MSRVLGLDDVGCADPATAGGKGASLARMRTAGLPVPPGFVVVAAALRDTLVDHELLDGVRSVVESFGNGDASLAAAKVQETFGALRPGPELAEEIGGAYSGLGQTFVAVRSSACAEDGETASFAGQQETFLNVTGSGPVVEKVGECWASFFSERAMFYRQSKGSLADLGMAVVVQEQLDAEKSGVIFTTDPIRQRVDQMVIEAAYGLGEALVSGMVTPDHYVAKRDGTLKKVTVGRQERMVIRDAAGGTATIDVDEDSATSQVLSESEVAHLVEMGRVLEETFGGPQDVEWAYQDGELFILQSRPITT